MLTFILQARASSLLIIDEPDIYLHADLQRQLIHLLEGLGPAVLLATHSTEIISEVEAESIVHISRKWRSAKRFSNSKQLHDIFLTLGSRLNPALTQLARTRVVLFLEGQDFKILSKFARKLGLHNVSNQTGFAIIPSQGFNPQKVIALAEGMEMSLDFTLSKAVIFDRDYRCDAEIGEIQRVLENKFDIVAIHSCKEIENYLLRPEPLVRVIRHRIKTTGKIEPFDEAHVSQILSEITERMKSEVFGQLSSRQREFFRRTNRTIDDDSAIMKEIHGQFEASWKSLSERLNIVPGKQVISSLNDYLQSNFSVSISVLGIADNFEQEDIADEMAGILRKFDGLCERAAKMMTKAA